MTPPSLDDFRTLARERLPAGVFDYIDGGACDEITSRANRRDLDGIRLLPLCLRDVADLDLRTSLLGHSFGFPVGFSPTAFHRLVHESGEVSAARAAKALDIPMIVSSMSSVAMEDVARDSGNEHLWFQTYIFKDRALTKELIQRAEGSGYKAIVLTVGCPVTGRRYRNVRNRFALPADVVAANFARRNVVVHDNPIHSVGADLDPALTWSDVEWLRGQTALPVVLKGIMNPLDVPPALDLEVAALILSNHGGRQLDTTESTIRMLPEIAAAVGKRTGLLIDSGFRRGTDVLKAIALGADGVLLGRPVMWALAAGGERGVVDAVGLLVEELRIAMRIAGCRSIGEIRENASTVIRISWTARRTC
ncbi:alpha-hydroxy acid oxidase [Nonomuraea sp. C10]|uniref:alpha-hydroxy acid oxidase n=1 Tax=Nonomuraea sp. C10 TaxID=2600577 RepID=UPI0011CDFE51|nr:alpha-hydroxy acid oxidase [Nonomuraea sp. C10]TXK39002.1 alpha-hydroxy-acid oxidizing protein [Nonomuraea sp. C10]